MNPHRRCLQAKVENWNGPKQVMPKSEGLSRSLEIKPIWIFDTEFLTFFNKSCTYITFKSSVKHRQLHRDAKEMGPIIGEHLRRYLTVLHRHIIASCHVTGAAETIQIWDQNMQEIYELYFGCRVHMLFTLSGAPSTASHLDIIILSIWHCLGKPLV